MKRAGLPEATAYYLVLWLAVLGTWLALDFFERRPFDLYGMTPGELAGNVLVVALVAWGVALLLALPCALLERAGHIRASHFAVLFAFLTVHTRFLKVRYGYELLHTPVDHRRWGGWLALALVLGLGYLLVRRLERPLPGIVALESPVLKLSGVLALLAALGMALASRPGEPVAEPPGQRPNIIFLTFDGMSASRMACYGYSTTTTPRLDRLAQSSWLFEDFRANANFTEGGMMALEGNFPAPRGAAMADLPGLSEALRAHGYPHQAFFSHGFAQSCARPGMERKLALAGSRSWLYRALGCLAPERWLVWLGCLLGEDAAFLWPYGSDYDSHVFWRTPRYPAELSLSAALEYLERHPQGAYVRIHLFEPHYPYLYEPALGREFGPEASAYGDLLYKTYSPEDEPEAQSLSMQYDRGLADVDRAVGDFLDRLQQRGLLDKAWLIVSSDHGESVSHGFLGHAFDRLPESVTRIPLIIRPPGNSRAVRIPGLCSQIDLAPTVLEALKIPKPGSLSGHSLMPRVMGQRPSPDTLVRCLSRNAVFSAPGEVALYWSRYRLSYRFPDSRRVKLFDLSQDPAAQNNIARSHGSVVTDILVRAGLLSQAPPGGP